MCIHGWWYIAIRSCHLVCPRFYDFYNSAAVTGRILAIFYSPEYNLFLSRDEIDNILMCIRDAFSNDDIDNILMCMAEWCFAFLK